MYFYFYFFFLYRIFIGHNSTGNNKHPISAGILVNTITNESNDKNSTNLNLRALPKLKSENIKLSISKNMGSFGG